MEKIVRWLGLKHNPLGALLFHLNLQGKYVPVYYMLIQAYHHNKYTFLHLDATSIFNYEIN